jgi:hypothetical protein
MGEHCCEEMQRQLQRTCDRHADRFACADRVLAFFPQNRRIGLTTAARQRFKSFFGP